MQSDIEQNSSQNLLGSSARYDVCVDILKAIANLSGVLLVDPDLNNAVNKALSILGKSIRADRLNLHQHYEDPSGKTLGYVAAKYEWVSQGAKSQINHPQLSRISYQGIEDCYSLFKAGKHWGGVIDTMPEPFRSGQLKLGVRTTYAIPILVKEKYWGIIGIDFCQVERELEAAEIEILKTAATCIGSAIAKDRICQEQEKLRCEAFAIEKDRVRQQQELERQTANRLKQHNQELAQRDRILTATTKVANALLTEETIERGVSRALQIIGETLNTDRVAVIENWHNPAQPEIPSWRLLYEWNAPQIISQLSHPELASGSYKGIETWYALQAQGQSISYKLAEMDEPFRSGQEKLGVKVLHAVPIFIEGKHWGLVGFDDCKREVNRSEAELSILKTVAACIGGAIERERNRCAKEEAEKVILLEREKSALEKTVDLLKNNQILSLRDKWLEATANAANELLQIADLDRAMNAALKVLGESLNCDRICIMKHFEGDREFVRMIYEWHSLNAISQMHHPRLKQVSAAGIEDWFATLKTGGWVGGIIDELREPFRSGQIELGVLATYSVPIFVNGSYWGAICVDFCRQPRRLTSAEISVFKTAASCIGSAMYRQQIQQEKERAEKAMILEREQAAREQAAELTKVNAVLSQSYSKLTDAADLNSFLGEVLLEITRQVNAIGGYIFLYDAKDRTLNLLLSVRNGIVHQGLAEHDCDFFSSPIPADTTPIFSHICQTREISLLSTNDDVDSTMWWHETLEWHRRMGHKEAASVALMVDDKPLGLLGLAFSEKSSLKSEELKLLYALTAQASLAIQLTDLAQKAQKSALIDERNRMAQEIHDTLAQAFTGISLQLEAARNILSIQPESARARLLQAKKLAQEGIVEARRSVGALRPQTLEFNNLAIALQQLVAKMTAGINIAAQVIIEEESPLSPEIEVDLYRIAQEAVTNTLRHAKATKLTVSLTAQAYSISLQIKDNGIGFNPQQLSDNSFGLVGMQERCDRHDGSLQINSASTGTKITITIPVRSS